MIVIEPEKYHTTAQNQKTRMDAKPKAWICLKIDSREVLHRLYLCNEIFNLQ